MKKGFLGLSAAAFLIATSVRIASAGELETISSSGAGALSSAVAGIKALLVRPTDDPATARQKLLDEKLLDAVSSINVAEIRRLVAMGANPNAYDGYKMTPLTEAAWSHGDADVMNALIDLGAQVDFKGTCDTTALQAAAAQGRLDAAQLLIARHATLDAKTCVGETALVQAAANDKADVFAYLLGLGANPNAVDWQNKTPLILAVNLPVAPENNTILAGLLADRRTDVNAADNDGLTALKAAVKANSLPLVKLLLQDPGINVNGNDGGTTALFLAELDQQADIAQLLRAAGAKESIAAR